jgi:tetratricopeptide (TPR) repeat protein
LGDNYQLASDFVAAREWQNAALELFQQINGLDGVCKVQSLLGDLDTREGKFMSARTRFDASLELTGYVDDVQHGLTVLNAGILEATIGNNEAARDLFEKSYHLLRETAELAEVTKAINNLAIIHETLGDKKKGLDMHEEALAIRRRINDRRGIVTSLINMSSLKDELGDYDEALAMAAEALSLSRDMGQPSNIAYSLNLMGTIRLHSGELEQARANLTEALEMRRKLTTPQNVVQSLNFLSMVAYQSGDPDAARDYYHEAFEIAGELETPAVQFDILFDLAQLLQAKKPVIAAEILAFLDARQDAAIWTKNLDEIWSELREKLNESVIAVVRQRAQQFDLEQIAARALDAL